MCFTSGVMHSGYPICCSNVSTTNAFNLNHMTTVDGPWGLFHEIGHNFNTKDYTVSATTEVTNNWWSFYLWGVRNMKLWSVSNHS